jgi:hypothetical protein
MHIFIIYAVVALVKTYSFVRGDESKAEQDLSISSISGASVSRFPTSSYLNSVHESGGSRISKSCYNYLLCETFPTSTLQRFAFSNGEVVIDSNSPKNRKSLDHINAMHASKVGHLPSCLASIGENSYDFVAGPKIAEDKDLHYVCKDNFLNHTALFLFPWESHNAYHSLNDNVLAVLSQLLLHRLLYSQPFEPILYKLYHFAKLSSKGHTTMYNTLSSIFGTDFLPSRSMLRRGPHCLSGLIWGSAIKSFYRDSLFNFRSELYNLLRALVKLKLPNAIPSSLSVTRKSGPKVVIVSRGGTYASNVGTRKLSGDTERRLAKEFEAQGATVSICCNFGTIKTAENYVKEFWDVDICVGVHGAGLSNCIFGRPGMIIIEFQTYHNYGFDSFMKIAHMAKGHYLFYDVRSSPMLNSANDAGTQLAQTLLQNIVRTSLAMWKFSLDHLRKVEERLYPQNMTAPSNRLLHSFQDLHNPDAGRVYTYKPPVLGGRIQQLWTTQELIIDFKTKTLYYHHPDSIRDESSEEASLRKESYKILNDFVANYLHFGTAESSSSAEADKFSVRSPQYFRAVEHAKTALDNLDKEQDVSERFRGGKNRGKGANFDHIDQGFLYTPSGNHQEVWIVFNPALFPTFPQVCSISYLFFILHNAYLAFGKS